MTDNPDPNSYIQGYRAGFLDGFREGRDISPLPSHSTATPLDLSTPRSWSRPEPEPEPFVPPPEWIPLRHIGNYFDVPTPPCGQVSHYLTRKVSHTETVDIEVLRKVDGSQPDLHEQPVCGVCGASINVWASGMMDYSQAYLEETSSKKSRKKKSSPPSSPLDPILRSLAELEEQVTASSETPAPLKVCGRCFEDAHTGPCETVVLP